MVKTKVVNKGETIILLLWLFGKSKNPSFPNIQTQSTLSISAQNTPSCIADVINLQWILWKIPRNGTHSNSVKVKLSC